MISGVSAMMWRLLRRQSIQTFQTGETGAVTIPFVLWLPLVLTLLLSFTDLSFILYKRSDIVRMVEDTNRLRAIGTYTTNAQAERGLLSAMGYDPDTLAAAPIDGLSVRSTTTAGVLKTVVQVPISELDAFGVFTGLSGNRPIVIDLRHTIENWEA